MKSLPANATTYKDRIGYSPRLFIQIADENKYYAIERATVDSQVHENLIKSMSPVEMAADWVAGLARASDFTFVLANEALESDMLSSYPHLENDQVKVFLGFDPVPSTSSSMVEIFRGVIDDWEATRREMTIRCVDSSLLKNEVLPAAVVERNTFAAAPKESLGVPLPWVFGDLSGVGSNEKYYQDLAPVPALIIDEGEPKYVIADHVVKQFAPATESAYIWFPQLGEFGIIQYGKLTMNTNDGGRTTLVIDYDEGCRVQLYHWPQNVESSLTSATVSNPSHALSKTDNSYAEMTANGEILALRLNGPDELGPTVRSVKIYAKLVQNDASHGVVLGWYDHNSSTWSWDTTTDTGTGWKEHDITAQIGSDWVYRDISIGVKNINAGTARVAGLMIMIDFDSVEPVRPDKSRPYRVRIGRDRRGTKWPGIPVIGGRPLEAHFARVYVDVKGAKDDASGTITGSADALLENPADILEGILRWRLNWTANTHFRTSSFDTARAALSGWKFAFSMNEQTNLIDFLDRYASESKSRIFWDYQDMLVMVVFDSTAGFPMSGTDTPADGDIYTYDPDISGGAYSQNPILDDYFWFGKTPLADVRNEFYFHYRKNPATGQYDKLLFCTASDNNLASPGTYQTQCANSQSNNKVKARLTMECDFIRDDTTAENLLKYYADRLLERKYLVKFRTWYNACGLEPGDFINIRHPLIENVVSGMDTKKWEVIGIRVIPPVVGDPASGSIEIEAVEV